MIRIVIDAEQPAEQTLADAARVLAEGGVIAFPTDTLYGLAADPRSDEAVRRIFRVKGRPPDSALPLIAASAAQAEAFANAWPPLARQLAERFWPGPLSLVVGASDRLGTEVLAGGATVAVRVPAHAVAVGLARHLGAPVTATSANRSGQAPAVTADEVLWALADAVDVALVLDAGACRGGAPSTLVDVTGAEPRLVRAGAVPWERVLESLQ